jgi:paraquat-inducible protein B
MSKKANTTIIGVFVIGAIILAIAGVVIFGSGKFFKETKELVLFFQGSVQGLNKGAPVAFKGVRIGSVTDLKIIFDSRDLSLQIPVFIEIEPDRLTRAQGAMELSRVIEEAKDQSIMAFLVEKGLRAQLDMQSLVTGQLFVNLDFFPERPARYVNIETGYPEIPTIPSSLENLSKTVEQLPISELASKANRVLRAIERWLNSPELQEIMDSTNRTMKHVASITDKVDDQIKPLLSAVDKTLTEMQGLVHDIRVHVNPVAADVREFTGEARKLVGGINSRLGEITSGMEKTLIAAELALRKAESTLGGIEGSIGDDSPLRLELFNTLKELSTAARSLRVFADYLERHPEALIRGKGEYRGR